MVQFHDHIISDLLENPNPNTNISEITSDLPATQREILEEIEAERQKQATSADECVTESFQDDNSIVLVACKDEHSCVQLEECIKSSSNRNKQTSPKRN
ncbi:hypothetical protein Tco_0402859 [Tanacetum coccineum]